jgi:hypothetical protein
MNIENNITGYINVFMVNNNFEENDATDNEDEVSVVEENDIILEENHAGVVEENDVDSDDEETVVENFDVNQLIEYHDDDETVNYDDVEEDTDDDEETIPDVRHITVQMKDSYCRFYVQHIYCYLKSWQTPNFDEVCQTEYGGDFERCVIDYMMPFVFNNTSFNNWLLDFAYRFDDSLNYLIHYLHEMEREDLINMLHEAIPPGR